jgi:hypothetical protein
MIEVTHSTCVALCSAYESVEVAQASLLADGMKPDLPYRGIYDLPFGTGHAYVFSVSDEDLLSTAGWTKVESA